MAHNNPKQKIQMHMQLKKENNDLKVLVTRLRKGEHSGQKRVGSVRSALGERTNGHTVVESPTI